MYNGMFAGHIAEQKTGMYTMHKTEYQNNESLAITGHGNAENEIKLMWHDLRSLMHQGNNVVVHTTTDIFKFELTSIESANLIYEEILHWCRRSQFTGESEPNCKGFYNVETGKMRWITDIGVTACMGEQILAKESNKDSEALLYETLFVDQEQPELHHICRHMSETQRMNICILGILDELVDKTVAVFYLPDLSSDDESLGDETAAVFHLPDLSSGDESEE